MLRPDADFAGQHLRSKAKNALGFYIGTAAGGNIITTALLDSTPMGNYEHLVVMDELINQRRSITGGITTDIESVALDSIAQCWS